MHSVTQFQTRFLAVSLDFEIEIFDILQDLAKVKTVYTGSPFQLLIPVVKPHFDLQPKHTYMLGAFIGYNYGSLL
jgi:hypothetical protein